MDLLKILMQINLFICLLYLSCNNENVIVEINKTLSIQFPLSRKEYSISIDTIVADYTNGNERIITIKSLNNKLVLIKDFYQDNSFCKNDKLKYVDFSSSMPKISFYYTSKNIEKTELDKLNKINSIVIFQNGNKNSFAFCNKGKYISLTSSNFSRQEFEQLVNGIKFL